MIEQITAHVLNGIDVFFSLIDWIVVAIVLASGFFAKRFLDEWKWPVAVKTFIVSITVILLYIAALKYAGDLNPKKVPGYFATFFFTTSLYEIVIMRIVDLINKKKEQ
jgi:hypothetical protein